jgi:hypothetical protein
MSTECNEVISNPIASPMELGENDLTERLNDDDKRIINPRSHSIEIKNSRLFTILLLNAMLGSGFLNASEVFRECGILLGTLISMVCALFVCLGAIALVDIGIEKNEYDYSELTALLFGRRWSYAVDVCVILQNLGSIMTCILLCGDSGVLLLQRWGCDSPVCGIYAVTTCFVLGGILPLCLVRHFGQLLLCAIVATTSMCCITLLVVIAGPMHSKHNHVTMYKTSFVSQLGSIIYTLSFSFGCFHSYNSLKKPSAIRWSEVVVWSTLIGLLVILVIGIGKSFKTRIHSHLKFASVHLSSLYAKY